MKYPFKIFKFFRKNGISGYLTEKIFNTRCGGNSVLDEAFRKQQLNEELLKIVTDPDLSDDQKRRLLRQVSNGVLDSSLKNARTWDNSPYRRMIIQCAEHPFYSQVKRKSIFVVSSVPMFGELQRGALTRALGQSTHPFTFGTYMGLALPVLCTASILEMVVPFEPLKCGCRVIKISCGAPVIILGCAVDWVTAPFEKWRFGQPLPADTQGMMGTLPAARDIDTLDDLLDLKKKLGIPAPNIDDINEETKKLLGTLFEGEDLSGDSMLEAMCEIDREFGIKTVGDLGNSNSQDFCPRFEEDNVFNQNSSLKKPTTMPSFNPGPLLGP